jgi:hypothetical protein
VDKNAKEKERRIQMGYERLGTTKPICRSCGETNPHCLEDHHIAGRRYSELVAQICANCHRKLSDAQKDHPKPERDAPSSLERIGHFLLGLADLLGLVIDKLREYGRLLISEANRTANATGEVCHE